MAGSGRNAGRWRTRPSTFPKSRFVGFDSHEKSVALARERAKQAGVSDRVTFEVAKSTDYPGNGYDLLGLNQLYEQITLGVIMILAVGLDAWSRKR